MTIPITNDCIVEHDETFYVHLLRTDNLDNRIMPTTEPAVVNIIDNDGRNSELCYISLYSFFRVSSRYFSVFRAVILYCCEG